MTNVTIDNEIETVEMNRNETYTVPIESNSFTKLNNYQTPTESNILAHNPNLGSEGYIYLTDVGVVDLSDGSIVWRDESFDFTSDRIRNNNILTDSGYLVSSSGFNEGSVAINHVDISDPNASVVTNFSSFGNNTNSGDGGSLIELAPSSQLIHTDDLSTGNINYAFYDLDTETWTDNGYNFSDEINSLSGGTNSWERDTIAVFKNTGSWSFGVLLKNPNDSTTNAIILYDGIGSVTPGNLNNKSIYHYDDVAQGTTENDQRPQLFGLKDHVIGSDYLTKNTFDIGDSTYRDPDIKNYVISNSFRSSNINYADVRASIKRDIQSPDNRLINRSQGVSTIFSPTGDYNKTTFNNVVITSPQHDTAWYFNSGTLVKVSPFSEIYTKGSQKYKLNLLLGGGGNDPLGIQIGSTRNIGVESDFEAGVSMDVPSDFIVVEEGTSIQTKDSDNVYLTLTKL